MVESIVEKKSCIQCGVAFEVSDKDLEFYDKMSPVLAGQKYALPAPKCCPDCRAQRRLSFRNERKLYRRTCDLTWKSVISIYQPEGGYHVCDRHVWRSDDWDPMSYGRAFDFTQSFAPQFEKLWKETPNVALYNVNTVNSEYANHCVGEKNCYMLFGCYENEDCMYGNGMGVSKNCMDLLRGMIMQSCYECVDCKNSYQLFWSQKCNDCSESYFLYNCLNCHNCVWCINLINKSYCIENIQYTKEEYLEKLAQCNFKSYAAIQSYKQKFFQLQSLAIHKFADLISCEEVTGDGLEHISTSQYCFDLSNDVKDCKFCAHGGFGLVDSYDSYGAGAKASLHYETVDAGVDQTKVAFALVVYESTDAYYCVNCHSCQHIFGCVGLRNKQYCIFNKQYTQEEYEKIVPQIIAHMQTTREWGEFFSPSISPFGYNETIAQDYFPESREGVSKKWYKRCNYEAPFPHVDASIEARNLPDEIASVTDDFLNQTITCEISGKPFRMVKKELEFYRKHNIPLPHKHPDQRHKERMAQGNPKRLRDRQCMKCGVAIKTSYAPERKEVIYCEACYNHEIYW